MVTEYEHVQALVSRLRLKKQAIEQSARQETQKIDETIHALENSIDMLKSTSSEELKLVKGGAEPASNERRPREGRTLQNRNVTELVRQFVSEWPDATVDGLGNIMSGAVLIPAVVKFLQAQGVKGEYRSLYSAVHVILRKEAQRSGAVKYLKGVGFYKPAK